MLEVAGNVSKVSTWVNLPSFHRGVESRSHDGLYGIHVLERDKLVLWAFWKGTAGLFRDFRSPVRARHRARTAELRKPGAVLNCCQERT